MVNWLYCTHLKKRNANNTDNCRGIPLVSCLGKLFTSILNKRLIYFDAENNVISDAQFEFRKDMSTVDSIFTLQYLIHRTMKNRNRLYCCFVDYSKAFDFLNRQNPGYRR